MSVADVVKRIESTKLGDQLPWTKIREDICNEYDHASTADRVVLLNLHKAVMDMVEPHVGPDLEMFRTARRQDYNRLLVSECIVGDGDVSPEKLLAVTAREVAAGRMASDHELRQLAIQGPEGFAAQQKPEQPAPKAKGWRRLFAR